MRRMNTPPSRPSFKAQMHQAREEAIVAAAGRLLGEKGFEAMTLDDVAAEVGVAKASLYKHFAGKDDLCAAAMVHAVDRLQGFLQSVPPGQSAIERLQALLRWMLSLQLTDEMPLLLSRNSGLAGPLRDCERYQASLQTASARITTWIVEAQEAGQLSAQWPPDVVLWALLARSADPLPAMLRATGRYTDARILDWAVETCFGGLAAQGVSAPAAPAPGCSPAPGY